MGVEMPDTPAIIRARVSGLLRGHDLEGDGTIAFEREAFVLQTGRARLVLELRLLEGYVTRGDEVELHLDGGDVVSLTAADPAALARDLERHALELPEFTRSLRIFGSRRAAGGAHRPEHDGFFAPLLAARGAAERASTAEARRAALDARSLRASLERRLRDFASERYPGDAPERRALEAELADCVAPMLERFAAVDAAQERLALCDDAERFLRWREWSHALAALFESADRCWPDLGATLTEDRREVPSRWRFLRPRERKQEAEGRRPE